MLGISGGMLAGVGWVGDGDAAGIAGKEGKALL